MKWDRLGGEDRGPGFAMVQEVVLQAEASIKQVF